MTVDVGGLPPTRIESVAERLYGLLPAHVRQVDRASGGALRALFGVLALPSADIDAETDAFHDALFVETAGAPALAAIAALVGAPALRPMPHVGSPGHRAYIANTIRYRRGKGTARVLETLAADVTGFNAAAVEYYQRLARLNDLLDVRTDRPGTANLVDGDTAARAGGAFDMLPRLLDVRPVARTKQGRPAGRHAISAVGVHVVRPVVRQFPCPADVSATAMSGVPAARPWLVEGTALPGYFQLAARPGAVLRLFSPDRRPDAEGGRLQERDLGERLRRLPLHRETDELRRATVEGRPPRFQGRPWFDDPGQPFTVFLRRAGGTAFYRVPPAEIRIANLEQPPAAGARPPASLSYPSFPGSTTTSPHPIACALDPVTGRIIVAQPAPGADDVVEVRVAYGTGLGRAIGAGAHERGDPAQPFEIRDSGGTRDLVWVVDPTAPEHGSPMTGARTVSSLAEALDELTAVGRARRIFIVLTRCDIEGASGELEVTLPPESEIHLVAAEWRAPKPVRGVPGDPALRGYIVRRGRKFTADTPLWVKGGPGRLVIDGLELTQGLRLDEGSVTAVDLRHVTLRTPDGIALSSSGPLTSVRITVDQSISGPIRVGTTSAGPVTGALEIRDSIVTADGAAGDTIAAPGLDCTLCNVTVLGPAALRALEATNTIFTEPVIVTRRQAGCVRYSFVPGGSSVPRSYRCQPALALATAEEAKGTPLTPYERDTAELSAQPTLMDEAADEPTLAMLHPRCPDAIRMGGEDGCEMGAFARAASGIAAANMASLFDDFLPTALDAGVIDDTRSAAITSRRNKP